MKRHSKRIKGCGMAAVAALCASGLTAYANPPEGNAPADLHREKRAFAYASALKGIYYSHKYPDGQDCGFNNMEEVQNNSFAVYDIDGDGKDELIVEITTTCSAGMGTHIYDWDETANTVREEFVEFPALTFYDNGTVKADWSHNQGLAGEFWPYTLYCYQPKTDTYEVIGDVDAWDRKLSETDYKGNAFPAWLDRNGNGFVYFINTEGQNERGSITVDDEEYQQWINGYLGNAQTITLPMVKLTGENIAQITNK